MAMLRFRRFCWYLRFLSVVTKTPKPALSAVEINSPFLRLDQPHSYAVSTVWPVRAWRKGAGVP